MNEVEMMNINGETPNQKRYSSRATLAQFLATLANSLTGLSLGMMFVMPSVVIGALSPNTTDYNNSNSTTKTETWILSEEELSWYGSLLYVIQPLGCLFGGYIQNYIGRKYGMMLMNIPQLAAWFLLYKASSAIMLHLSSILMGLSIGFTEAPGVAYVCEITEPRLRGTFTLFGVFMVTFGTVVEYFLSSLCNDWKSTALYSAIVPLATLPLLALIPDSPMWLLSKNREEKARKALCWLRGWIPVNEIETEFNQLCYHITNTHKVQSSSEGIKIYKGNVFSGDHHQASTNEKSFKSLLEPSTMKPMILLIVYGFFGHCAFASGSKNEILNIFRHLEIPMNPNVLAFITVLTGMIGTVLCILMVSYLGKRPTSLISMSTCCITTILIGLYAYYRTEIGLFTIGAVLFCLHSLFSTLGIISIPWIMMGEIFPLKTRALSVGIIGAIFYLFMFFMNKTYIYLEHALDIHGCFLLYGFIGIIGLIYIYYYLPETEGKSLIQIEEIFSSKKLKPKHFRKL